MRRVTVLLFTAMLALAVLPGAMSQHIGRQEALDLIGESESYIEDVSESGYGVEYFKALLDAENKAFERADIAEMLRNNQTNRLSGTTIRALRSLDYGSFSYDDVLQYHQEIKSRRQATYDISDSLYALDRRIDDYSSGGIDVSEAMTVRDSARDAFDGEKYEEAESLVVRANSALDEKKAGVSNVKVLISSGSGFFERNVNSIAIFAASISIAAFLVWKLSDRVKMKNELKRLKVEEKVLMKMMRDIQTQRFDKNSMSKYSYEIRMEKCVKRLNEVRRRIPVLERK